MSECQPTPHQFFPLKEADRGTAPVVAVLWVCQCGAWKIQEANLDVDETRLPLSEQLRRGRGKRQRNPEAEAEETVEALRD